MAISIREGPDEPASDVRRSLPLKPGSKLYKERAELADRSSDRWSIRRPYASRARRRREEDKGKRLTDEEERLRDFELVDARLYTGPMFCKYNTVLQYHAATHMASDGVQNSGRSKSAARRQEAAECKALWNALCRGNEYGVYLRDQQRAHYAVLACLPHTATHLIHPAPHLGSRALSKLLKTSG